MYICKIVSYKVHLSISDLYKLSMSDKCNYVVVFFVMCYFVTIDLCFGFKDCSDLW